MMANKFHNLESVKMQNAVLLLGYIIFTLQKNILEGPENTKVVTAKDPPSFLDLVQRLKEIS